MISRAAAFVVLTLTASCQAGLLGAGHGEGSCAAAPFRTAVELLKWPAGCPPGAECCTEFGYCRPHRCSCSSSSPCCCCYPCGCLLCPTSCCSRCLLCSCSGCFICSSSCSSRCRLCPCPRCFICSCCSRCLLCTCCCQLRPGSRHWLQLLCTLCLLMR